MVVVPASLLHRRRIIRVFHHQGATHPAAAIVPSRVGLRQSFAFQQLVSNGVLVPVSENRYYLDVAAEAGGRRRRQRIVLVVVLALAVVVGAAFLFR